MLVLMMLAAAQAAEPQFGAVTLGKPVPDAYKSMCAPFAPNAFRCQAVQITVAEVTGNMAVEKCGEAVHAVKFVSLVVPGSGHDLPGATVSKNVLDDTRAEFDKLRAYFVEQGFTVAAAGDMGAVSVEGKREGATLALEMGPVTGVPELPKGAWQAGAVVSLSAPCTE